MRSDAFKGAFVGAVMSTIVLAGGAAIAGTGVGAVFNLGGSNSVNKTSTLHGATSGPMLQVSNGGSGAGLRLNVKNGKAPIVVNSGAGLAKNLNADKLDGKSSNAFLRASTIVMNQGADWAVNHNVASSAEVQHFSDGAVIQLASTSTFAEIPLVFPASIGSTSYKLKSVRLCFQVSTSTADVANIFVGDTAGNTLLQDTADHNPTSRSCVTLGGATLHPVSDSATAVVEFDGAAGDKLQIYSLTATFAH